MKDKRSSSELRMKIGICAERSLLLKQQPAYVNVQAPLFVLLLSIFAPCVSATTHFVDLKSSNPVPPFADWSTAATKIQDAVDYSVSGDVVLVADGPYGSGGRPVNGAGVNRAAVTNAIIVRSLTG